MTGYSEVLNLRAMVSKDNMTGYSEVLNLRAMIFKRQYDRIF
jgi:hypothetical protein